MIKVVIVDDEEQPAEMLRNLISAHCKNVDILGTAASAAAAYQLIQKTKPDIVYLDIEMPFENGFNLLEKFENIDFEVVFVTAYDQYAIQAIKYSALDYLLKPVNIDDLKRTLEKFVKASGFRLDKIRIETLLNNLKEQSQTQKILLPCSDGFMLVNLDKIISCVANGNYTIVNTSDSPNGILVAKTLKHFEEMLPDRFYRIHNSTIINLNYVKKYSKEDGGYAVMKDDSRHEISRRKKIEFMEKILSIRV